MPLTSLPRADCTASILNIRCLLDMDSALIPSQSGPVFSQQGTVDWTQLANSSVTFSLGVLSRLSKAGVEPFTLAVGQAIFLRFPLPPETQQEIHTTLANLKPFSSYGNVLWFGFGIKHVARCWLSLSKELPALHCASAFLFPTTNFTVPRCYVQWPRSSACLEI